MCKERTRLEYASIPTLYAGVWHRGRGEARYSAFSDLQAIEWHYEPLDLIIGGRPWQVDHLLKLRCKHYECRRDFTLLVEVKPHFFSIEDFKSHQAYELAMEGNGAGLPCDAVALFGANPEVSYWKMTHRGAVHEYSLASWFPNWLPVWNTAGNIVQTNRPKLRNPRQLELWNNANAYGNGETVLMRAPNGQTKAVQTNQVDHYKQLGAVSLQTQ